MNWLDMIFLGVVVLFVIRGIIKGLFREVFGLAGIFLGIIIAINRYEILGRAVSSEFSNLSPKIASLISFALIFIGVALLGSLTGMVLHKISQHSFTKTLDQGGGFLLGLFEGSLICSAILIFLNLSPLSQKATPWIRNSTFSPYLIKEGSFIYDKVISLTPGQAKKFMEKLESFKELGPEKGVK